MCYELSLKTSAKNIEKLSQAKFDKDILYTPYYIVSSVDFPNLYAIIQHEGKKILRCMEWGMVASWGRNDIKNYRKKNKNWNVPGEHMMDSPTYSEVARSRRCLILADGFIAAHYPGDKFRGPATPKYCYLPDNKLFYLAGLFNEDGNGGYNCTIVTVNANPLFAAIQNKERRMPLVLEPSLHNSWLDHNLNNDVILELVYNGATKQEFQTHSIKNFYKEDFDMNIPDILQAVPDLAGVQGRLF